MKKQTTNNPNSHKGPEKSTGKNTSGNTNSRYIYTEEDLGEDILHVGLGALDFIGKQNQFNSPHYNN